MKKCFIILSGLLLCVYIKAQETIYTTGNGMYSTNMYNKALNGDGGALNDLGSCFDRGAGVAQNHQKAFGYFQESSNKDFYLGHFNLGLYYEKGYVCEKDYHKAFELYSKSLEEFPDFIPAQLKMGKYYALGLGVEKNVNIAREWFEKVERGNFILAIWELAGMYSKGIEIPKDMVKAVELYKKCEVEKFPNEETISLILAGIYDTGVNGNPDYEEAFQYWMKLAEVGEKNKVLGEYKVGEYYDFGRGVERNKSEAISWYTKAANKGHGLAQYKVGMCMYYGETISQNYKEAVRYFELALKDQYLLNKARGEIMRKLSACYRFGRGVSVDVEKADYYMKEAARYGDADAQKLQEYLHIK